MLKQVQHDGLHILTLFNILTYSLSALLLSRRENLFVTDETYLLFIPLCGTIT